MRGAVLPQKNTLLHPVNELRFGSYRPDDVAAALDTAIGLADKRTATLLTISSADRTYANTVQAMEDATEELELISHIVSHFSNVLGSDWEAAEQLVSERMTEYYARRAMNVPLYEALTSVQERQDKLGLSAAQKRLLHDEIVYFERGGIRAAPETKKRLKAIKAELAKLDTKFGQNVTKANDATFLAIASADDLAGVQSDLLEVWAEAAKDHGKTGYVIPYNAPNYQTIMTDCSVFATRQKMHRLARSRAPENEALATKMLTLRAEFARLLGYKTYADYATEQRMAKTGKRAVDFIADLTRRYLPAMHKETKELEAFVAKITGKKYALDITDVDGGVDLYYANKLRSDQIGEDISSMSEYFPLDHVLAEMFVVLHTLYGVSFKPSKQASYHKDVHAYDMFDEQGRHLATVWCDWLARKGKRGGAWQHTVYVADRANDRVDEPHLAFVCANFPAPTKQKPSLLNIRDVETMWHEFGHFIHAALGKTELREHNGLASKWDFIEAPSQIMENWVWQDEVLAKISKHYKTGKSLPPGTIRKMRAARAFRAASVALWTLHWSYIDLYLHTEYDPKKDGSIHELYRKHKQRFFGAPVAEYDCGLNTFSHIFAGGYAAAYYGYKWAESIEADLFSRFIKEGVLNPKTGRDYRDQVLAPGDEQDPEVLIRNFLGRPSKPDAMLQRDGIR